MNTASLLFLSAGEIINQRWQIIDLLHIGGVSEIYKVTKVTQDEHEYFALKIVKDKLKKDDTLRMGFQNEISVLTGLPLSPHPNAPQFEAAGEWRERIYVVMEFVSGTRLDSIIASRVFSQGFDSALFRALVRSMCGILQDLQWMGVIHGDIAPSNIIRNSPRSFKLIDFNFARFVARDQQSAQVYYKHDGTGDIEEIADAGFRGESERWYPAFPIDLLFGRRRFPGQLAYAAPERIVDPERTDFRSDIFSFGLVLYHLLAGILPYQASSLEEKKTAFEREKPSHVCDHNPMIPRKIGDYVMTMIAKNLSKRPVDLMKIVLNLTPPPT
jgi:serine/threonine protein kinase